jgi:ABC-type multidrug transport system fused ATPase/permease subunit
MTGRTTFIAAHRLSTIEHADQILVIDAKRVVEQGRHESLWAKRGRYYEIMRAARHSEIATVAASPDDPEPCTLLS